MEIVKYLISNHADVNARSETGDVPLHKAVRTGNKEILEFLLKHGAYVNVSNDNWYTPLMLASELGRALIAELLLHAGAQVNTRNYLVFSPLHLAAKKGHYNLVELLLKYNADVDCKYDDNATALHVSAFRGHTEIAKLLIEKGADINATDSADSTPLHVAADLGHKDIVDLLINNGADINCKNENGSTALHFAASGANRGIVESLLRKGADMRVIDEKGNTPLDHLIRMGLSDLLTPEGKDVNSSDLTGSTLLHVAAFFGDQLLVEHCIENGCDINARTNSGSTALHLAAQGSHPNMISFLLSKGMEIDAKDGNGETPLLLAAKCNCSESVEVLVSHDMNSCEYISDDKIEALRHSVESGYCDIVDILLQNYKFVICYKLKRKLLYAAVKKNLKHVVTTLLKRGFEINDDAKPLHVAVRHSHYHMAELLLTKGANPNLLDKDKCTPLDISVKLRDAEMIEILLSQKADIRMKSKFILSAAESAIRTNQLDIIELLLQMRVIKANAKGNSGYTFLHSAALSGALDVTKYLVAEGADINAKDKKNRKPVHIAAEKGFRDMVEFYLNSNDFGDELPELLLISADNGKASVCEFLLEKGVDVNACHMDEETALKSALVKDHKEVLSVLLHYGAYYNAHPTTLSKRTEDNDAALLLRKVEKVFTVVKNNASAKLKTLLKEASNSKYCIANPKCVINETVLHYASLNGYNGIVNILLKYNADPNARTKSGETPLHYAVKYSHFGIVKSLLSNGAMHNSISRAGKTPLDYATDREIRDFLLFLNSIFRQVQENDLSVLGNLRGEDEDTMRSVIRAKNQEGKTLIDVAHICDFSKIIDLQLLFEPNPEYDAMLAQNFFFVKRYTEAFLTWENLLNRRVKIFGADSLPVFNIKFRQAIIWREVGNPEKAMRLLREVHEARKKRLGEDHRQTLSTETDIADLLSKQGKTQEVLRICEKVRLKLKQKLEADDLFAITNELRICVELLNAMQLDKALKIIVELEEDCSQNEKISFMFTRVRFLKAEIFKMQGNYSEALELFKDTYYRRSIINPLNPDTIKALSAVADVLSLQKKYDESLEVWRKVLDIQKCYLPENHIDILKSEFSIGDVLLRQGKLVTPLKFFLSLEPRIAAFGPDSDLMKGKEAILDYIKEAFSSLGLQRTFERIQNDIRRTEQSHGD
ncbi:Serine/threonine-protein phosphatase 6 regulatory ankyrin repeat subunit A [Araneus ventricosus]|uniref:Alpha-latrotoxin n=1 Tax=Araneus ventricosus TaxID=182803 RepID=A0A4Y2KBY0_ARAVE|nr:Serine/threonine-protein phosphatase 6 regulatory ankyrin repeat subunit A [Araneus ventricosus]